MTDVERLYSESYPPSVLQPGPPPTVTLLTPSSVSLAAMPALVTITGTGFAPGMSVLVDGVVYPSGTFVSPTSATFVPDAESVGVQQVGVEVGGVSSNTATLTVTALAQGMTIAEVQAFVDAHDALADEVLVEERAGAARVTLIDWLEGFIAARDEEGEPTP